MKTRPRREAVIPLETDIRALPRGPEDDFFCARYQVWYPSFDCAVRTRFKTSDGCLQCDQGRFNEHRHAGALSLVRFRPARTDDPLTDDMTADAGCGAAGTPPES